MTTDSLTPTGDAVPATAWRALAVGAAGFVLVGFNGTATNIAFGDIAASFPNEPETTVGFVSSGYLVGTAAFLPLAGRIADRTGRRRVFLLGVALFGLTAMVSAIASNIWVLVAARFVQSIGGALVIPASLSMVLPLFPVGRRSSAVATWAAAGPVSAAIAPTVSAAALQISNWRWLYFASAPIAIAVIFATLRQVEKDSPDTPEHRLDLFGAGLGTAGIALAVFGVSKGKDWGWASPAILGFFVVAALCSIGFLAQSRRHREPMIDLTLFRIRQVWMANLANALVSITSLSIWLVWPLYLERIWGYSKIEIGLALTAGPIAAATMTLVGGRVADRFGHRWPIQIGSLVMVFAVGWCWLVLDADGRFLTSFLPGILSFGFGWGLSSPTMNSFALAAVPEATWGAMNAAFNMLRNVAGAIGVAAAVAFTGAADRPDIVAAFDRAFGFFFAFTLAAALVAIVFYPRGDHA